MNGLFGPAEKVRRRPVEEHGLLKATVRSPVCIAEDINVWKFGEIFLPDSAYQKIDHRRSIPSTDELPSFGQIRAFPY